MQFRLATQLYQQSLAIILAHIVKYTTMSVGYVHVQPIMVRVCRMCICLFKAITTALCCYGTHSDMNR